MTVTIYTRQWCSYCVRAKHLLDDLGVVYQERPVDEDAELRAESIARSGERTFPQIWVGDQHVGGCDELRALHRKGELVPLLDRMGVAHRGHSVGR